MAQFSSIKVAKSGFSLISNNKTILLPFIVMAILSFAILFGSVFAIIATGTESVVPTDQGNEYTYSTNGLITILVVIVSTLIISVIQHVAEGTVIAYALDTFRGKKTSTSLAFAKVRSKIKSITLFALLSGGIAATLQQISDKLPFAGKLTAFIAHGAWSIASAFAVPVIVGSEKPIGAIDATKKSVDIIKNSFGENVRVSLGLALITIPVTFLWALTSGLAFSATLFSSVDSISITAPSVAGPLLYTVVSGLLVISTLSVITGVTRAALYYYVTTGKAPEQFNKDMFKSMITQKKARKIFGKTVHPF